MARDEAVSAREHRDARLRDRLGVRGPWRFSELWIVLGFAAIVLSTFVGMAIFGPGWAGAARLADERDAVSPELSERVARPLAFAWVDLGLLLGAVWVMSVKPSREDVAAVLVALAIPLAGAVLGLALRRRMAAGVSAASGAGVST